MAKRTRQFRLKRLVSVIRGILGHRWGYACTAAACLPGLALAGPAGEQVVAGTATVTRPDAATTKVLQSTNKAIINWQNFSIGSNEYVQFTQPGSTAIALNRVVGGDPSQILGQLSANGRVFLVNPHGVYFGPSAQIDVNGLVASVLDIKNEDFMAGNYVFSRAATSPAGAAVVNQGTITTQPGGFVVLAGNRVENSGEIQTPIGTTALAAGNRLTLGIGDTGLVDVSVSEAAVDQAAGVTNSGQILADGGRVVLSAKVAAGVVNTAVNNQGLVQAHSIREHGGVITLSAAGGDIANSGTVDASGQDGQAGGEVQITGDKNITLEDGSSIHADGAGAGNGGTVKVVADRKLAVNAGALVSAKAGSAEGTGGFIELSGHESLGIRGTVALGEGGTLLLDPSVLTIVGGGNSTVGSNIGELFIEGQLNSGVNVLLAASNEITTSGTFSGIGIDATTGNGNLYAYLTSSTPTVGIALGGIGINIRGNLVLGASHVVTGTATTVGYGNITAGNLTSQSNNVQVLTHSGNITVGNVAASGWESFKVTGNGTISTGTLSAGTYAEVLTTGNGGINVGNIAAGGYADLHIGGTGPVNASTIATGSYAHVFIGGTGNITIGTVSANGSASIKASNGNVTTTNSVLGTGTVMVAGNNIQVNGIMQARTAGSSLGGNLILQVGTSLQTGAAGRLEGHIQVDGFEGMPGPIGVNITTRSPQIAFGTSTLYLNSGSKVMDVQLNNTAYTSATNVTFNLYSTPYAEISFGTVGLTFGGSATITSPLSPMVVNSFAATTTGGGNLTLSSMYLQATTATGINLTPAGDLDLTTSTLLAPVFKVNAGGALAGGSAYVKGSTTTALQSAGNLAVGTLEGGYVELKSSNGGVTVDSANVGAFDVRAHGAISLGSVTVGSTALTGKGDVTLISLMQSAGLPLPTSTSANAVFRTEGNITINSLTLTDPYPYIAFVLNGSLSLGNLNMSGSEILAQFAASDPSLSIGVEALAATLQDVNFNQADHFSLFPGTTIAIGVGEAGAEQLTQQGNIVIGTNGIIDMGSKNFVCLSVGQCVGLDKVVTSGKVLSLADASVFNVPLPQEFNDTTSDDENNKNKDVNDEGEGGSEGGSQSPVTHNSGSEKMCQ